MAKRKKRILSAEHKAAISRAQKRRWDKYRKALARKRRWPERFADWLKSEI